MKRDISGQKFGRLLVLARAESLNRRAMWNCRCDCGVENVVRGTAMTTGNTSSCGCGRRDAMAMTGRSNRTHGQSRSYKGRQSPTYVSWQGMIQRCYYEKAPNFYYYGARGVTVCDRWRESFEAFLADVGERPANKTIDRYPNSYGNYEPGNVRWATPKEQSANRRKTA